MILLNKFKNYIKKQNLFDPKDILIIAVSGGVDSVVLCELCKQAAFKFIIAHCNFQLRGEESNRDEIFVKSLGEKYMVKVFIKKFLTEKFAEENRISIQVAARELRYAWFDELMQEVRGAWYQAPGEGIKQSATSHEQSTISNQKTEEKLPAADSRLKKSNIQHRTSGIIHRTFLLTAHHANDNIETMLMNFFKGTGIAGLKGIEPKKEKLIRPLLFAKKQELQNFAAENNLAYVEDSSNLSDKYTRNFFRNQLIPSLQKVFPGAEENLINNIDRFKDIETLYLEAISLHKKKLMEKKENEIHIPVLKLLKLKPLTTIVFEIIKEFGFTTHQTEEVIKLLNSDTGKFISSATHKIIKNRNWIIIAPNNSMESSNILISENDQEIKFERGKLKIEKGLSEKIKFSADNSTALLDANTITFPLLLRKWKQGDYFYPLGLKKASGAIAKKKLSKFFVDQKLSLSDKEKIWVIESNKKITWIVGKRIDERFKVSDRTVNLVKIHFSES